MPNPFDQARHKLMLTGYAVVNELEYEDREVDGGPGICIGLNHGPGICIGFSGRSAQWEEPEAPADLDSDLQEAMEYAQDNELPYTFTTNCC